MTCTGHLVPAAKTNSLKFVAVMWPLRTGQPVPDTTARTAKYCIQDSPQKRNSINNDKAAAAKTATIN